MAEMAAGLMREPADLRAMARNAHFFSMRISLSSKDGLPTLLSTLGCPCSSCAVLRKASASAANGAAPC